jgi:hypothetical protein
MRTLRRFADGHTLTLFAADSPARTSAPPADERGLEGSGPASGTTSPRSSSKSGRRGSSSKTSRRARVVGCVQSGTTCTCSDIERAPWGLPQVTSELRIDASESSLLPTLTETGNMLCPSMQKWPSHRLLPTLTASIAERGYSGHTRGPNAQGGPSLAERLLPTLTRRDEKGPGPTHTRAGADLPQSLGGHLSADWCRWFMGFPAGWLDVDDDAVLARSATPSSRNARKSSAG